MTSRRELKDYADAVVEAVGNRKDLVVVGQSFGAFTAPWLPIASQPCSGARGRDDPVPR